MSEDKQKVTWDEEAVYDAQMRPLLRAAHAIAVEHKIPFLSVTAYAGSVGGKLSLASTVHLNDDGRRALPLSMALMLTEKDGLEKFIKLIEMRFMLKTILGKKGGVATSLDDFLKDIMSPKEEGENDGI